MPNLSDKGARLCKVSSDLVARIERLGSRSGLTDWEVGFLDSCLRQVQEGRTLTEKQHTKLDFIEAELPLRINDMYAADGLTLTDVF